MANNVKLINLSGEVVKEVPFAENLLVKKVNKQAMFDTVIAEDASRRQGTASTLTKGEVRGGGKKPFMQKHTGNARQGSTRNPQWVGGGIAFGPKPNRNYIKKVNNKVIHLAFKSALTEKVHDNMLALLNVTKMNKPSTKSISKMLKKLKLETKKVLFVLQQKDNLTKSIRNMPRANAKLFNQVSTRDIMHANYVIIDEKAIEQLGKAYK
ncbi:MAG: 50S ribosomal protein L4 [Malacoplasma sp.]|nr:50S ribosomal protein L4 [Malacoplasma sp.]